MPRVMKLGSEASSRSPMYGTCVRLTPLIRNVGRIATIAR